MKTRLASPLLLVAVLAAAVGFTRCGGSNYSNPTGVPMGTPTPAPGPTPSASGAGVISGFAFSALTVPVNTTVTWRNDDSVPHTATADSSSAFQFDTGNIAPGATSQGITFTMAGTFTYHCNVHSSMHGTIVVQ
jgi:plastocyanin